jgi:hypothetical protein
MSHRNMQLCVIFMSGIFLCGKCMHFSSILICPHKSRDSVVGIETGYRLDDREVGVRVPVGSRIFYSPRRPDRLWSPPSLLSNGYAGAFLQG